MVDGLSSAEIGLVVNENEVNVNQEAENRRNSLVKYFSETSGFPQEEVEQRLGSEILKQFESPIEEIIPLYFQDPAHLQYVREQHPRIAEEAGIDQANAITWQWLFSQKLLGDRFEEIQPEDEKVFEVVAYNSLTQLQKHLAEYSNEDWNYRDGLREDQLQRVQERLNPGETLEQRLQLVQTKLEEARKQGFEAIQNGNIPIIRVLYFRDPEKRRAFLDSYKDKSELSPRHAQAKLEGLTLHDVARHTQNNADNTPMDSWTYAAPNSKWFYGSGGLALGTAVILQTEVPRDKIIWSRQLGSWISGEVFKFYQEHRPDAPAIPISSQLADLNTQGIKGALSPTEIEAVMWGNQPKVGIIDLSTQ